MKKTDMTLEQRLKQSMDESIEQLPDTVTDKLALARQKAVLTAKQPAKAQESHWGKPLWAMAATVCLALPLWYSMSDSPSPLPLQSTSLNTVDIMISLAQLDEDEMEVVENLEFALWLSEQDAHG